MNTMNNLLIFIIKVVLKIITYGMRHEKFRIRLGQIYNLSRQCAQESYISGIKKRYCIDPSVRFGVDTLVYGKGKIKIGKKTYLGRNCFVCADPSEANIDIGKYCAISHNVHIRTRKRKKIYHFKDELTSSPYGKDIIIEDYVWIGANVFISGGVTIGENSIIGANSVVVKDIPPNTVYGGVPAKYLYEKKNRS